MNRSTRLNLVVLLVWIAAVPAAADGDHVDRELEVRRQLSQFPFEPDLAFWTAVRAENLAPDLTELALGAQALAAEDAVSAQEHFENARRLADDSPYASYYLGRLALERGDAEQALDLLGQAVRQKRGFAGAYRLIGYAHLQLGNVYSGFSALRTVIALEPGIAQSHFELGRAYLANGRPEHAAIELTRAHELDASNVEALFHLGYAYLNAGQLELGFEQLQNYIAAAQDSVAERDRVERARKILSRFAGA